MRRLVYLFALPLLFLTNKAEAQSFTMQHDTINVTAYGYADIYNYVTNNTSDTLRVKWRVIYENLPQSWEDYAAFGICDNVTCYDKAVFAGGTLTTDTIGAGSNMPFKMQIDGSSPSVTSTTAGSPMYVSFELSEGTTIDTVTFAINKWGTNISRVNNSRDEIAVYPNPAQNEVNVTFNKELGVKNVAIYNLVGKQVSNYRVSNNSAKLDIEKIPAGIYFLRLVDGNGRVVATRRFTHQ